MLHFSPQPRLQPHEGAEPPLDRDATTNEQTAHKVNITTLLERVDRAKYLVLILGSEGPEELVLFGE